MDMWSVRRPVLTVTTITILTPARLTATTDLAGSRAEFSLVPGPGTTAIGEKDTEGANSTAADGAAIAASVSTITMAAEDTMAANAATTAEATVADMPAAHTAAVMHEAASVEVSIAAEVEVSTAVEEDSTVAAAAPADTDNSCSDLS
jgi:hypothetical protein